MMKTRIFNTFVYVISVIALLLLQGCDKEPESLQGLGAAGSSAAAKQVDMTAIVPIHPSSLEYFDYCISYTDNMGKEFRDTVRNSSSDNDIFYWKQYFSYKSLPIACRCEIRLVPKVSGNSVVSFSFVVPKPYIFSRVIFSSQSYDSTVSSEIEGPGVMEFEDISIDSFMSAYGSFFVSNCSVKEEYGSINCMSY